MLSENAVYTKFRIPSSATAETTQAYMETLRDYLERHGRLVALYSDKHSIC